MSTTVPEQKIQIYLTLLTAFKGIKRVPRYKNHSVWEKNIFNPELHQREK
ncbi:hypothetical protein [Oceanicoccus sagamiensis]|nr:hypothetical protein [Oceanicoccus sagamiensis]